MAKHKPKKLGKYEILEELGRGGFSVVYKALDPSLDRTVALKVLKPHYLDEPEFVGRFQREAKTAAGLFHPNIVTIFEVSEVEGTHFIAMRYLQGQPLSEIIKEKGPFNPEQAIRIAEQIGSALDYIQSLDLVHRDVKPHNIIVGDDDHATLTDFGLVRAADGTRYTTTGDSMGTPEYMSPEQAEGEELDHRSDLYSFGVVVYEMLAGQVPFRAETPLAVLRGHADKPPPRPREMNPDLTSQVEDVLLRCLAKDKAERFQSGRELASALQGAVLAKQVGEEESADGPLPIQEGMKPESPVVAAPAEELPALDEEEVEISEEGVAALQEIMPDESASVEEIMAWMERSKAIIAEEQQPDMSDHKDAPASHVTLREYCEEANELIRSDSYDQAIAICRHILEHFPKHLTSCRLLGEACLEKGDYVEAADLFERVLGVYPEDVIAYVGLGIIHDEQEALDEAIWQLERAFELTPGNAEIRGELQRLYGDRDGTTSPKLKLTPAALGRTYLKEGLYQRAIEEFKSVLEEDPERADIQVVLAEALWWVGQKGEAAEVSEGILEELPNCLKANLILGEILLNSGREEEGRSLLRTAQAVDPENIVAQESFRDRSPFPLEVVYVPRFKRQG